jgi:flagellar biogenesis protein FliO
MAAELGGLLRLLASLGVVLALAVVLLRFVLPRLQGLGGGPSRTLEVLETRLLDRHNRLVLVRVEGGRLLLAVGPSGTRTLRRYEDARDESAERPSNVTELVRPKNVAV